MINSNIRCIETIIDHGGQCCRSGLIVIYDVLKRLIPTKAVWTML